MVSVGTYFSPLSLRLERLGVTCCPAPSSPLANGEAGPGAAGVLPARGRALRAAWTSCSRWVLWDRDRLWCGVAVLSFVDAAGQMWRCLFLYANEKMVFKKGSII